MFHSVKGFAAATEHSSGVGKQSCLSTSSIDATVHHSIVHDTDTNHVQQPSWPCNTVSQSHFSMQTAVTATMLQITATMLTFESFHNNNV